MIEAHRKMHQKMTFLRRKRKSAETMPLRLLLSFTND